jgi:hypothetical protein
MFDPLWPRLLACTRGSTLIGYSSLMLLVAIAAITLLAPGDMGFDGNHSRPTGARPAD